MTFAVRKTVANELFVQLEHLFAADAVPDQFTLTRLEREAKVLDKVDASDASMVKAGIAALRWDFDKADYWVKNSLYLEHTTDNLLNAALTYRQLNRLDMTTEMTLKSYELAPRDAPVVNSAIKALWMSGQFVKASTIYNRALGDGVKLDAEVMIRVKSVDYMTELGISSERVVFEVRSAQQVLANNCKRMKAYKVDLYADHDESPSLVIQLEFAGNIADELRMESELAQVLAEEPGWSPGLLTTELQYMVPNVHEHA
jgi:tetratricopeptide (TPR) repeat protein